MVCHHKSSQREPVRIIGAGCGSSYQARGLKADGCCNSPVIVRIRNPDGVLTTRPELSASQRVPSVPTSGKQT